LRQFGKRWQHFAISVEVCSIPSAARVKKKKKKSIPIKDDSAEKGSEDPAELLTERT